MVLEGFLENLAIHQRTNITHRECFLLQALKARALIKSNLYWSIAPAVRHVATMLGDLYPQRSLPQPGVFKIIRLSTHLEEWK
jgi:hypothetical protein